MARRKIEMYTKEEKVLLVLNCRKLSEIGGSHTLIVPKMWAELYGKEVNGSFWVKVVAEDDGSLRIKPVDEAEYQDLIGRVK